MKFRILKKLPIIFFLLTSSISFADDSKSNRIEVLVNENAITKYDIIQRIKINSILKRIEIDDSNYNQILNSVIDDLITEELKIKKIEEYEVSFDQSEFEKHETRFFSSINYKKEDLEELFIINNVNYKYLTNFLEVDLKWQKLIYGLYLRVSSVTDQEIIDLISKNPDLNEETASNLILQRQLDLKSIKLLKDLRDEATIEYK
tara:strand:+ start:482 stop:1093 length:612 start_codon:yes stop_codon:yes gene_type:complete